jgi:hypothetical protein
MPLPSPAQPALMGTPRGRAPLSFGPGAIAPSCPRPPRMHACRVALLLAAMCAVFPMTAPAQPLDLEQLRAASPDTTVLARIRVDLYKLPTRLCLARGAFTRESGRSYGLGDTTLTWRIERHGGADAEEAEHFVQRAEALWSRIDSLGAAVFGTPYVVDYKLQDPKSMMSQSDDGVVSFGVSVDRGFGPSVELLASLPLDSPDQERFAGATQHIDRYTGVTNTNWFCGELFLGGTLGEPPVDVGGWVCQDEPEAWDIARAVYSGNGTLTLRIAYSDALNGQVANIVLEHPEPFRYPPRLFGPRHSIGSDVETFRNWEYKLAAEITLVGARLDCDDGRSAWLRPALSPRKRQIMSRGVLR